MDNFSNEKFWNTWITDGGLSTRFVRPPMHEVGHALGMNDFTHLNSVKAIKDGGYCSVMIDYHHPKFSGLYTWDCAGGICVPNFAVFPGPVDERAINHLYYNISSSILGSCKPIRIYNYANNIFHSYLFSVGTTMSHQTIDSFFRNIALYPNQSFLPKEAAHFLADTSVLAGIIFMEFSVWPIVVYSVANLLKYLPQSVIDKLPYAEYIKSNYSLYLLSLSHAVMQGLDIIPLCINMLLNITGVNVGKSLGEKLGSGLAWAFNYIPQTITGKFFHHSEVDINPEINTFNVPHSLISSKNDMVLDLDIHEPGPAPVIEVKQTSWCSLPKYANNIAAFFQAYIDKTPFKPQINENKMKII
jgi:hypothetical protein